MRRRGGAVEQAYGSRLGREIEDIGPLLVRQWLPAALRDVKRFELPSRVVTVGKRS
jgi:hypothetical protein